MPSSSSTEMDRFQGRLDSDGEFMSHALAALRAAAFEPGELIRFGQAAGFDLRERDLDGQMWDPAIELELDENIMATEANSTEACTYTCGPECH